MGDGVLVYFGYPQAHEDDAERAVRAGLELVAAVSDLKIHPALRSGSLDYPRRVQELYADEIGSRS